MMVEFCHVEFMCVLSLIIMLLTSGSEPLSSSVSMALADCLLGFLNDGFFLE